MHRRQNHDDTSKLSELGQHRRNLPFQSFRHLEAAHQSLVDGHRHTGIVESVVRIHLKKLHTHPSPDRGQTRATMQAINFTVNGHRHTGIVELTAIVWSAEDNDHLLLGAELVIIFDNLMRSYHQVHVLLLQEACDHVRPEGERDAAVVLCPAGDVHVEVAPEQVVDDAGVGDVQRAPQASDLVHDANLGREAAYWEAVEDVTELLPRLDVIAALAFVVEAVEVHDRCTRVIAPKQSEKFSGYFGL